MRHGFIKRAGGPTKWRSAHVGWSACVGVLVGVSLLVASANTTPAKAAGSDCLRLVETIPTPTMPNGDLTRSGEGPLNVVYDPSTDILFVGGPVSASIEDTGVLVAVRRSTGETLATIPLGGSPFSALGIDTVTHRVYAGNRHTREVAVIDGSTLQVVETVPMPDSGLVMDLAVDEANQLVYVSSITDQSGGFANTISVIDETTNTIVRSVSDSVVPLGQSEGIAVDPVGNRLYVAGRTSGRVVVLDASSLAVVHDELLPLSVLDVAADPASERYYVAATDGSASAIRVYDTQTDILLGSIPTGVSLPKLALDAGRQRLYVSGSGQSPTGQAVAVIDTAAETLLEQAPLGLGAWEAAVVASSGDVLAGGRRGGIDVFRELPCTPADATPPEVSIAEPVGGSTYPIYSRVRVSWSCADLEGGLKPVFNPLIGTDFCFGVLDGTTQLNSGNYLDTLTPGTHSFAVTATNNDNQTTVQTETYDVVGSVDTTGPPVQITSPAEGANYAVGQTLIASFSCGPDDLSGLTSCYGSEGISYNSGDTIPTYVAGPHSFYAIGRDWAGNQTLVTVNYTVGAAPNPDANGDGVADAIGTGAGGFDDGGGTSGSIVLPVPAGATVSVVDAPAPGGVDITVGGTGQATFTLCGWPFPISMSAGSHAIITCGSVKAQTLTGAVRIPLSATATVTVGQGSSAEVAATANGGFSISGVVGGVTLVNGSTSTQIPAGQPPVTVDVTAPLVTPVLTGTQGATEAGITWYRSAVGLSWTVSDPQSTISNKTGCGPATVNPDTTGTTRTCTARSAGGTSSAAVTIHKDATPPNVSFGSHPSNYTIDQTVAIGCNASDATSGIKTGCQPFNSPAFLLPLGSNTRTTSATDKAGNSRSTSTSFTVKLTAASLCNLTKQFVHSSAKYQAASPGQRTTVDLTINAACNTLKPHQVSAYKTAVTAAATNNWLTPDQANRLRAYADRL